MKFKTLIAVIVLFFFSGVTFGADIMAFVDLKKALNDSDAGAKAKAILYSAAKKEDINSLNNLKAKTEGFIIKELLETLVKISSKEKYSAIYLYLQERKFQDIVSGVIIENFSKESAVDLTPVLIKEFNKRTEVMDALSYESPYLNVEKIENAKKEVVKSNKEATEKTVEANEAFYKGDFQAALNKHSEAFSIREKNNDKFSMATSAINIAANYYHLKNYSASKEWATRAKELAESSRNNIVLGSSISLLASLQIREGEFSEAIEAYKTAIDLFEEPKEAYAKFKTQFTDEELLAKFNTSRKRINDSLENLTTHQLNSIFGLGIAYAFSGDYNTALASLKKFTDSNGFSFLPSIMRESYKLVYEATLAYAEGCELLAQDDYENAITKFKKAKELYIESMAKLDSAAGVVSSMKQIGDIYLKQNRKAEALDYYKQALEYSDKNIPALKEKYGLKDLILTAEAMQEKNN